MHHMQQHKIKLRQQESVYLSLISHCREWTREPIKRQEITHITLTRLGPRRGDPDKAVVFAMWAIRDAICAWIALGGDIRTRTPGNYDDIVLGGASPRAYLTMQYAQELAPIGTSGKRGFGVQIELDRTPGFVPPPRAAKKILAQGT
jgi:hypothetical protein